MTYPVRYEYPDFPSDKDIVYTALVMRKNKIETGNSDYSAQDLANMKKTEYDGARIRALDVHQMKVIVRINELMTHILNNW